MGTDYVCDALMTHATVTEPVLSCDDDNLCSVDDVCAAGTCAGTAYTCADDGNVCTDEACDGQGGCPITYNNDSCDDGDACTHSDACAGGNCNGALYQCEDDNTCTLDTCNGDDTCTFTPFSQVPAATFDVADEGIWHGPTMS